LWSWFSLVSLFTPPIRESWKSAHGKQQEVKKTEKKEHAPKKTEEKAPATKDECDDLFGDDAGEDDATALQAMKDKKEKDVADKKAKADKEKKKPEVIAKSLIVLDVKTWGDGNEDDEEEECEDDEDVEEGAEPKEAKPTKPVKEVTPEEVENRKKISQKHYEDLANKIMTIEKDGLFWKKEFKIEEVAFWS